MRKRDKFLVFGAPNIGEAEISEVSDCLRSGWLGTGPKVAKFEADFACYKAVEESNVAAVNSCTAALHISLLAAGVGPGDEVITTAMTFCATANAIIHSGATPVLADIDSSTLNIDPASVESKITEKTKAVLVVHFAGRPCEMDRLTAIAEKYNLTLIEDCAHAIESEYAGKRVGTFGEFGCFSFYVTKNVVTGEGGMIVSRSSESISRAKMLSLHGMSKDAWRRYSDTGYAHYTVEAAGFKYNMMDLQAAIGIHQLAAVEKNWVRRQTIWNYYQHKLKDLPLVLPAMPAPGTRHAYHLFPILIDKSNCGVERDEFIDRMTNLNIGVGVHYICLTEHPFYREQYNWSNDDCPVATKIGHQTVSIPLSAALTDEDLEDVVSAIKLSLDKSYKARIAA